MLPSCASCLPSPGGRRLHKDPGQRSGALLCCLTTACRKAPSGMGCRPPSTDPVPWCLSQAQAQALKCMLLAKIMQGDSSEVPALISARGSLKHAGASPG